MSEPIYSVSEINLHTKDLLDGDPVMVFINLYAHFRDLPAVYGHMPVCDQFFGVSAGSDTAHGKVLLETHHKINSAFLGYLVENEFTGTLGKGLGTFLFGHSQRHTVHSLQLEAFVLAELAHAGIPIGRNDLQTVRSMSVRPCLACPKHGFSGADSSGGGIHANIQNLRPSARNLSNGSNTNQAIIQKSSETDRAGCLNQSRSTGRGRKAAPLRTGSRQIGERESKPADTDHDVFADKRFIGGKLGGCNAIFQLFDIKHRNSPSHH